MTATPQVRIGVYVCDCGFNIAGKIDVPAVVEYASTLPGVVIAREYKYMCSDPGQMLIRNDVNSYDLNRVVVASCSPLMHERTFRNAMEEAGENRFLFHMANIREGASWVTEDGDSATQKAKALVAAAVRRVTLHEPLEPSHVKINPDILVIGGGIAGITAALTLANAGYTVHLVEREPSIGGQMARFDKTFPTLDCASCILTPKMTDVKNHPNIHLLTYSEVMEVEGFVGNFKVKVKRKPRYVHEDLCVGCYECIEACVFKEPKFPSEFDLGLGKRKPIYIPFPQAIPLTAVIDPETCIDFKTGRCPRTCEKACGDRNALDFTMEPEILELEVGTIIVATGFKTFDPRRKPLYGYGKYPNVYTALEVERLLNSAGPTSGEVRLRNGTTPRSVGIVHCVGSRDEETNRYCSRVCCMYSLKLAHMIQERTGAKIYNFYIDIRTPGKGYEEFYNNLLEEGIEFIRGRVAEVTDLALTHEEEGHLIIRVEDTLAGIVRRIPVDMVVLSVGLEPALGADEVRRMLGISCSTEGFFLERHPKLAPIHTFADGIFIAGACQGPKDIPDTVAQAGAAAAECMAIIQRKEITLEPNTVVFNEDLCSGCHICVSLCPYHAFTFDAKKNKAVYQEALCKGCGVCVAACPSGALDQKLFSTGELLAEIDGLLGHIPKILEEPLR